MDLRLQRKGVELDAQCRNGIICLQTAKLAKEKVIRNSSGRWAAQGEGNVGGNKLESCH
jgi:hypothetical protein